MPKIDIATALAWAKERFPSPVVRRPVDDLLAHCPRVEGELIIQCKDCKTEVQTMIDKSKRKVTVEKHGDMIVIRMTGGPDCLWLNMYLDPSDGQMTCDSDIGFYSYHWGKSPVAREGFVEFCCRWLENEDWLLRKCIMEQHVPLAFNMAKTGFDLRNRYAEYNGEYADTCDLEEAIGEAAGYSESAETWSAAFSVVVDAKGVDLPEDWYECVVQDYTPWQKRFAEICREVIVPALKQFCQKEE